MFIYRNENNIHTFAVLMRLVEAIEGANSNLRSTCTCSNVVLSTGNNMYSRHQIKVKVRYLKYWCGTCAVLVRYWLGTFVVHNKCSAV